LRTLLSSEFTERAPAEVVQRERNRLADLEAELRHLVGD
jgi:valyl-tRNA synthetase